MDRHEYLEGDLAVLVFSLEMDSTRLENWGAKNGVFHAGKEPRWLQHANPKNLELAQQALLNLKRLYEDTTKFRSRYDVQTVNSIYTATTVSSLSIQKRVRWAILDASRFEKLVVQTRHVIDGLVGIDLFQGHRGWRMLARLGVMIREPGFSR